MSAAGPGTGRWDGGGVMRNDGVVDAVIDLDGLARLLGVLGEDGYRVIGPTRRGEAIVLDEIDGVDELPVGWGDDQAPGAYRLRRRDDDARFGYTTTTTSPRPFLHPPREPLVTIRRSDGSLSVDDEPPPPAPLALIGIRACDLAGIGVQDRVFAGDQPDPRYAARRRRAFVVAVNCGEAGRLCFCASVGTGPRAGAGHDLALTELRDGEHRFVVDVASDRGRAVLDRLPTRPSSDEDRAAADRAVVAAAAAQTRRLDPAAGHRLQDVPEHLRWDDVAARCLSCTNCTLVCPTCFCGTVEDHTDLTGSVTERVRRWDSCFSMDHSHLPEGSVRADTRSRYRQWLTHKVSWWIDQYDVSGCVGCGRCIAWCPVGIDLTEEVGAMTATGP